MTKDFNISRLRVAFTIWIVFFHSANQYIIKNPLYDIHFHEGLSFIRGITILVLQGFVFISGILMARGFLLRGKYHEKIHFCIDKAKRLLIPYLIFGGGLLVLYPVSWGNLLCGAKHLWFLLMLFDVMMVAIIAMPSIEKTNKLMDVVVFLTIFIFSIIGTMSGGMDWLRWKTTLNYLPPFFIGVYMVKYKIDEILLSMGSRRFYLLFFSVLVVATIFIVVPLLPLGTLYMYLPNYLLLPLLYVLLCRTFKKKETSVVVKSIDKNSLGIYILHNFVGKYTLFYYVPAFVTFYDKHCVLAPICLFAFMFPMAWFVSFMMQKNKYTAMLIGS